MLVGGSGRRTGKESSPGMGLWPGCCRTQLRDAMRLKRALSGVEPSFTLRTAMLSAFGMVPRSAGHLFRRSTRGSVVGRRTREGSAWVVPRWR